VAANSSRGFRILRKSISVEQFHECMYVSGARGETYKIALGWGTDGVQHGCKCGACRMTLSTTDDDRILGREMLNVRICTATKRPSVHVKLSTIDRF
jgi:hypothetical protein